MSGADAFTLFQNFGPVAAVIMFFVWRDYHREEVLSAKLSKAEAGRVDDLKTVVANNTAVLQQLRDELRRKPCLFEAGHSREAGPK